MFDKSELTQSHVPLRSLRWANQLLFLVFPKTTLKLMVDWAFDWTGLISLYIYIPFKKRKDFFFSLFLFIWSFVLCLSLYSNVQEICVWKYKLFKCPLEWHSVLLNQDISIRSHQAECGVKGVKWKWQSVENEERNEERGGAGFSTSYSLWVSRTAENLSGIDYRAVMFQREPLWSVSHAHSPSTWPELNLYVK